jgi:hypothetical protein
LEIDPILIRKDGPFASLQLKELAQNDSAAYPNWWRISEEAADMIEWISGRSTEIRARMNVQNEGESESS